MHRTVSFKENEMTFTLMRNRREEICEIPTKYIESITYSIGEHAELTFAIPSKITYRGKTLDYTVYNETKAKMLIIVDINGQKEKFIIDDEFEIEDTADISWKRGKAYSYEKKLDDKTFIISEGATRQLYRKPGELVEVSDGILNWLEQKTQWKVGHIDELAQKDRGEYPQTAQINIGNVNKDINKDDIIWQKGSIGMSVVANTPVNLTINYPDFSHYRNNVLQKSETITHEFVGLPYPVVNVWCKYTQDTDFRYGATYTFEYSNGVRETFKRALSNIGGSRVVANDIKIIYETGRKETKNVTKYRYFEQCSTNWYSFLVGDVAKAFNCIFLFDSYNQVVNVYDKDTFGTNNGLHISYETGVQSINKKYVVDEIITRLYIESPNVSIASENPLGGEYVENYDYYRNSGIMSTSLQNALTRYDALLETQHNTWKTLKVTRDKQAAELSQKESQLTTLGEKLKTENAVLTAYIKAGNTSAQAAQSGVVTDIENQISTLVSQITTLKEQVAQSDEKMTASSESIVKEKATDSRGKIFTEEDLLELDDYTIEGSITNDYFTTAYSLYNWAVKQVESMNALQIEFDITTTDLLRKIVHPEGWQKVLTIGEKIEIDDKDVLDKDGYIQLFGYTFYPSETGNERVSNLQFTNNREPVSATRTLADIGRATNQQVTLTNFYKEIWKDSANLNVDVAEIIKNGLDLSAQIASGRGTVNKIDISESGIYITDANDEKKGLYFGSGLICMTKDKWKTSEVAIDSNGIIAQNVVGKLILGDKVQVGNSEDTFTITGDGIRVTDSTAINQERIFLGLEKQSNGSKKAVLRLRAASGSNQLVLSENGIWQCFQIHARDSFDRLKPFEIPFYIPGKMQRVDEAKLILKMEYFRAYSKGASTTNQQVPTVTIGTSGGYFKTSSGGGNFSKTFGTTSVSSGAGVSLTNTVHMSADTMVSRDGKRAITRLKPSYHSHTVVPSGSWHSHKVNVSVGNHTHGVDISSHGHSGSVTIPGHSHNIIYGIYEYNHYGLTSVQVDGGYVVKNTYNSGEFNILNYLNKTNGQVTAGTHTIKLTSASSANNPNGIARASVTVVISGYMTY